MNRLLHCMASLQNVTALNFSLRHRKNALFGRTDSLSRIFGILTHSPHFHSHTSNSLNLPVRSSAIDDNSIKNSNFGPPRPSVTEWKVATSGRGARQVCAGWRRKDTKNVLGRAKKLITQIEPVSDLKDDVYAVLDNWCAWETVFPMLALKNALQMFKKDGNWKRIIQVSKWMLAKGQGKTLGTFEMMIEAYNELDRVEEMEALWIEVLEENLDNVPRSMFWQMMKIYEGRNDYYKVLEVWGSMEALSIKPNDSIIERVSRALVSVGAPSKVEELEAEYPPEKRERFKKKPPGVDQRNGSKNNKKYVKKLSRA